MARSRLVLASASPRRRALLQQIGIEPDAVLPTNIDERAQPKETPAHLAERLAIEKAEAARRDPATQDCYILAADTVVAVGRRMLPKTEEEGQARACLDLLSGRNHRVFTGVSVMAPDGRAASRCVATRVTMKRLSGEERRAYLASGEWRGKAGGYGIQGRAGAFIINLVGSYPAVMGLPLYETVSLLQGLGFLAPHDQIESARV